MTTITELQQRVAAVNIANGWRSADDPSDWETATTRLVLINTEIAEAVEEIRNGHAVDETYYAYPPVPASLAVEFDSGEAARAYWESAHLGKPEGVPSELADVAIRLLDTADSGGSDLAAALALQLPDLNADEPLSLAAVGDFFRVFAAEEIETIGTRTEPKAAIASLSVLFHPISDALLAIARDEPADEHLAGALGGLVLIARAWGIDIAAAIDEKLAYNATRGHRHGGKTA